MQTNSITSSHFHAPASSLAWSRKPRLKRSRTRCAVVSKRLRWWHYKSNNHWHMRNLWNNLHLRLLRKNFVRGKSSKKRISYRIFFFVNTWTKFIIWTSLIYFPVVQKLINHSNNKLISRWKNPSGRYIYIYTKNQLGLRETSKW